VIKEGQLTAVKFGEWNLQFQVPRWDMRTGVLNMVWSLKISPKVIPVVLKEQSCYRLTMNTENLTILTHQLCNRYP
jgi:hypothetical protein